MPKLGYLSNYKAAKTLFGRRHSRSLVAWGSVVAANNNSKYFAHRFQINYKNMPINEELLKSHSIVMLKISELENLCGPTQNDQYKSY